MEFQSILGVNASGKMEPEEINIPRFFADLNLDQIVQDIMEKQKLYDIRKFYYEKPKPEDIPYRLEVLKDLEKKNILQSLVDFALGMRKAKEYLNNIAETKLPEQKQKWKLDSADQYISSVLKLHSELMEADFRSQGLISFRTWLNTYVHQESFVHLKEDTQLLSSRFYEMKFNITVKRDRIIIEQGYLEQDYCKELQDTFKKETEITHYYQKNPFGTIVLSSLEREVLEILKKPYAGTFEELAGYDRKYQDFMDETMNRFELESQFYIAFLLYRAEMEEMGFHFCYPRLSEDEFRITEGYDLALARKNAARKKEVVFNDATLKKGEQFLVITGPNQGGKTTFARALGQILYFGLLGLMVPARTAVYPMFDCVYTHFATEESLETGAGKLKEELIRLKDLMDKVTRNSFIIINEIFTSATSYDAYIMGKKVIDYFMAADCLGVYVTHIHELTKEDDRIVSMVASLLSEDSSIRTFRIERRKADGRSYANTIVEKYHMSYEEIKERIRR